MRIGYYGFKCSSPLTIFPFTTRIVMKRGIRISIAKLIKIFKIVYEVLQEKVEKTHEVTKILRRMTKTEREVRKVEREEFRAAFFNEVNEEDRTLKTLKEIEEICLRLKNTHKGKETAFNNILKSFSIKMQDIIRKGENETKYLDLRMLGAVIKEAEKPVDVFMEKLIMVFKEKELPKLAELAGWLEAGRIIARDAKLKGDKTVINNSLKELRKTNIKPEVAIQHLNAAMRQIEIDADYEFLETYIFYKRLFLAELILLRYIDHWIIKLVEYREKRLLPTKPVDDLIKKLQEDKKEIDKDAHILAQGFLILISKEEKLIRMARAIGK